jgi:hypothetical protein
VKYGYKKILLGVFISYVWFTSAYAVVDKVIHKGSSVFISVSNNVAQF